MSDPEQADHVTLGPVDPWPQALVPILAEPVSVSFVIGRVSLDAAQWSALGSGEVLAAGDRVHRQVRVVVAGRTIGQGELVNVEGMLGVRILALNG